MEMKIIMFRLLHEVLFERLAISGPVSVCAIACPPLTENESILFKLLVVFNSVCQFFVGEQCIFNIRGKLLYDFTVTTDTLTSFRVLCQAQLAGCCVQLHS